MSSLKIKTSWLIYKLLVNLAGPPVVALATIKGRFGERWSERLGLEELAFKKRSSEVFCFHAASVGEARSAAVLINIILKEKPQAQIYFSISTPAGLKSAEEIFKQHEKVRIFAAPLDFWGSGKRLFKSLKPDYFIIWETELWPNLIAEAQKSGATLVLAAARMTAKSFKRYSKVKSFMTDILNRFDLIAPVGDYEKNFFISLGAPEPKIKVLGNPKFDMLLDEAHSKKFNENIHLWRQKLWGDFKNASLILAASTHLGEENLIIEAYKDLKKENPELKLILAPRHLNRLADVKKEIKNFKFALSSDDGILFQTADVVLLDSLGQLSALYALCDIAVIGGSFFDHLNGHNPLEAAAVACPIIFGPYMESFKEEAAALVTSGGAVRSCASELTEHLRTWLNNPPWAEKAGLAAKSYLGKRTPVANELAKAILNLNLPKLMK